MTKLNRNDTCWCNSKKKYKKCHLEFDEKMDQYDRQGYPIPDSDLYKSESEIIGIKKACQLTSSILDRLTEFIKPGITTDDINTFVHDYTIKHGATPAPLNYRGFPKSICTSLNEVICHGIPSDRVLIDGDILNVDVTCILDGYYGDSCRMYMIGTPSKEAQQLVTVTKECLELGIKAVKPFDPISKIGDAISSHAHKYGYGVVEMFGGHGIGTEFHTDPFIYHYSRSDKQMIMAPNMIFTIEPMINIGKPGCKILADNWTAVTKDGSLSAQWEHQVLVTETGVEVLT